MSEELTPSQVQTTVPQDVTVPVVQAQEVTPTPHADTKQGEPQIQSKVDPNDYLERERIKMSQLERERNELKAQAEESKRQLAEASQASSALEKVSSVWSKNKTAYEEFRKEYNLANPTVPLDAWENMYGAPQTTPTQVQQPLDQNTIVNNTLIALEQKQAFDSFMAGHDDINPTKSESPAVAKENLRRVTALADQYLNLYPGMKPGEALENAYMSLPENRAKASASAEENALLGQHKASAMAAGTTTIPSSGGNAPIPSSERYRQLNGSQQKRYLELQGTEPDIAEIFLNNCLGESKI